MFALPPKQETFCLQYIIDKNATRAYMAAYPSVKKESTAAVNGSRLLINAKVQSRIAELLVELAERCKLKAEDVINELRALAFWNIQDFISEGNTINDLSKMERATLKPVAGIKVKKETRVIGDLEISEVTTELKLTDNRGALVDLGRHLGIFKDDNDQKAIKITVKRK
jgi:phage terminase small subunit